jgi:MerR family transcriptional regulator, copper efflux regulator
MKVYLDRTMSTELRIKEIAEASGFPPATLRYYEQIGLLPEASRTPAGYRVYGPRTLERLAFIARAKQLGCTLDEIAGLTAAWEGGQCGPVQEQLRNLVAAKIAAARNQILALATFTSELQHAAAALERHRPEGACDSECGCVSDPGDTATAASVQPISLTAKPAVAGEPAVACTLLTDSMRGRIDDWQALLDHVERREPIDGGVRNVFGPSSSHAELIRLVVAEQDCCQFFQFTITVDTRGIALEVRAPDDARPIVEAMFGVAA